MRRSATALAALTLAGAALGGCAGGSSPKPEGSPEMSTTSSTAGGERPAGAPNTTLRVSPGEERAAEPQAAETSTSIPASTCQAYDEFMTALAAITRNSPPEELELLEKAGERLVAEHEGLRDAVTAVITVYRRVVTGGEPSEEEQKAFDRGFEELEAYLPCRSHSSE